MSDEDESSGCGGSLVALIILLGIGAYVVFSDSQDMRAIRTSLKQKATEFSEVIGEVADEDTIWLRADNPYWSNPYITEDEWGSLDQNEKMYVGGWEAAWHGIATLSTERSAGECTPSRITQADFEKACRVVTGQNHSNYAYAAAIQAVGYAQVRECGGGGGWLPNYNSRLVDPTPLQTWR